MNFSTAYHFKKITINQNVKQRSTNFEAFRQKSLTLHHLSLRFLPLPPDRLNFILR